MSHQTARSGPCGLKDGHGGDHRTPQGVEAQRARDARYDASPKGKARDARYKASPKGKARNASSYNRVGWKTKTLRLAHQRAILAQIRQQED